MAKTYKIDPERPSHEYLRHAAQVLSQGGLVVFPTETFYGIAADSENPKGLERLAQLKGREAEKPFPLIIASVEQLEQLAEQVPEIASKLISLYWPGPLTLVMNAKPGVHARLLSKDNGVGVRVSPWPCARALAEALGRAITATSANLAGGQPAQRVEDLDPEVVSAVNTILDGGPSPGGQASTVLDVRLDPPKVLRQGPIHIPEAIA
jgi:L-threonylcarbamoyladenylate synthase